ncbi:MAG: bifunctional folylpolyglutamate synthase/dihydrofolate synthase [Saprospiraceae bacterium]|nr:bifunctional folylpolyglutamate synthase/dihydrofolate synthase [Saprospiraceae bacterium]
MTYKEVLHYLFSKLPMYSRVGAVAYKKDLTRTLQLCELLGNPEKQLKCIHVAGTNGKGSVTHMIASGLIASGYKVGIYSSPHYKDYRERIKINNEYIPKTYIRKFIEKYKLSIEEIEPSFFELTVAIAFDYFHNASVDFAIIETGLGGRLDSTNVIQPILSVITNISWDHMDILGDSLEKIAIEKAGIIKEKVPVVIGRRQKQTHSVFTEKAKNSKSKLIYANDLCSVRKVRDKLRINDDFSFVPDLTGPFQEENYKTSYAALSYLNKLYLKLQNKDIKFAFENVRNLTGILGRWQLTYGKKNILLDSAHNLDGIQLLLDWIKSQNFKQLHFVLGFVKDKSLLKILNLFPESAKYYFTQANIPRALGSDELANQASEFKLMGTSYKTVKSAYSNAQRNSTKDDLVIVCGSIFVVAEVI